MFKNGSTKTFVRGILHRIVSHYPRKNLQPYPKIPTTPNFACVTPYTTEYYKFLDIDAYTWCIQPDAGQAFYVMGVRFIFLCPSFWAVPAAPSFPDCPSVQKNQWVGPGQYLSNYRSYLLIHEMVHFYLGDESLGTHTDPPETYLLNDCVGLNSFISIRNPQNYQNYVARTIPIIFANYNQLKLTIASGTSGLH